MSPGPKIESGEAASDFSLCLLKELTPYAPVKAQLSAGTGWKKAAMESSTRGQLPAMKVPFASPV
jgi:hypothetical protein